MARWQKENKNANKKCKEQLRVKKIGEEYQALSDLLGLKSKRTNKVQILKAVLQYLENEAEILPNAKSKLAVLFLTHLAQLDD